MIVRTVLTALALAALSPACFANAGGATSYTLRDQASSCGGCHGAANPAVAVSFVGPTAMLPGQTVVWTANISGPSNATARAGFAAAIQKKAELPTFTNIAGQPTVTSDSSTTISHGSSQGALDVFTNGTAQYTVNLTMPANAVLGNTYQLYMSGNAGFSGDQVGWQALATKTLTVGPPKPTSLTANQATATASAIQLTWAGTQGEHFKVLRKTGGYPTSATDAAATAVYEGANTSATASNLTAGTTYYFAAFGKAPAAAVYSADAALGTAATLPANPTSLTAMASSSTEIGLTWNGTSAEFRVLGKAGAYPANATDPTAEVVYQGPNKNAVDSGLSAGTGYFYRVWGRVPNTGVYSANFQQATATTTLQPIERYVDVVTGSDQAGANACNVLAAPCRTITRAMAAAGGGDMILVQPGTYSVTSGEVFPIAFKSGVQLIAVGSPVDTFIDGAGDPVQRGLFTSTGNNQSTARIEGFTIRNGFKTDVPGGSPLGGAVYINAGNAGLFTITRNIFASNETRGASGLTSLNQTGSLGWGGAIAIFSSVVNVTNNVFAGNIARGGSGFDHSGTPLSGNENGGQASGGAIYFAGSGLVVNNSFVANYAIAGNGGVASDGSGSSGVASGGAIDAGGNPSPTFVNNIFSGNAALPGSGQTPDPSFGGALLSDNSPLISNNLFFGNLVGDQPSASDTIGVDAVLADPKFQSMSLLRLRNSSPANGAGLVANSPAFDIEENARPNPPSIGAYEASFLSQTLAFGAAPTLSVGGTATVSVSGGLSSQPTLITSQTTNRCTVSGTTVTGVSAGTCTLVANRAGDVDYTAAAQVSISFAVLAQPSFLLTVTRNGSGGGLVTSAPAGIDCGATCSANFVSASNVILTASPHAGSQFIGWTGACAGAQTTCQVSMTQVRTVNAQFDVTVDPAIHIFGDGFEQ